MRLTSHSLFETEYKIEQKYHQKVNRAIYHDNPANVRDYLSKIKAIPDIGNRSFYLDADHRNDVRDKSVGVYAPEPELFPAIFELFGYILVDLVRSR
jgi:hypothetical protein